LFLGAAAAGEAAAGATQMSATSAKLFITLFMTLLRDPALTVIADRPEGWN